MKLLVHRLPRELTGREVMGREGNRLETVLILDERG